MTRQAGKAVVLGALAAIAIVACGSGDLLVGDDSRVDAASPEGGASDATLPKDADGGGPDAAPDASPSVACADVATGPGTCLPVGTACRQASSTAVCPAAGTFCCTQTCPELAQPPPAFCDGGGFAPIHDAKACIVGFACTPVSCVAAGGACVGLAPGTCPSGHVGDASKYSCGSGLGTMCCLP